MFCVRDLGWMCLLSARVNSAHSILDFPTPIIKFSESCSLFISHDRSPSAKHYFILANPEGEKTPVVSDESVWLSPKSTRSSRFSSTSCERTFPTTVVQIIWQIVATTCILYIMFSGLKFMHMAPSSQSYLHYLQTIQPYILGVQRKLYNIFLCSSLNVL